MIATESRPTMIASGACLATLAGRLVAEMEAACVPEPLSQPVTVAAVLSDLFRLAGLSVPRDIADRIG